MATQLPASEGLPHATIVFVGHHQSGKSTTAGHIILKLGGIDKRAAERVERETSSRPTSRYAWVLDRLRLERDRAMTVDLKLCRCVLPPHPVAAATAGTATAAAGSVTGAAAAASAGLVLTLIDTPGHPDYLRNCIAGITQADVAVVVVDSRPAVLESPSSTAQTRDMGTLVANLVKHRVLVVAINHLDAAIEASEEAAEQRFNDAVAAVAKQLKRKEGTTVYVPVSGYTGDNLLEPSNRLGAWWKGGTLLDAIVAAAAGAAAAGPAAGPGAPELPLRIPVIGVYKVGGIGTVPIGRVAGGCLRKGATLAALPAANPHPHPHPHPGVNGTPATANGTAPATAAQASRANGTNPTITAVAATAAARSIESFHEARGGAACGDWVGVSLKGVPAGRLRRGCVLSDADDQPARLAASFTAKIQMFRDPTSKRKDHARQLKEGYVMLVHVHTAQAPCRLVSIKRLNTKGEPLEGRFLRDGDIAEVELRPLAPLCLEPFAAYPHMGRFVVRAAVRVEMRGTQVVTPVVVAVGRVEAVQYVSNEAANGPDGNAKGAGGEEQAAGQGQVLDQQTQARQARDQQGQEQQRAQGNNVAEPTVDVDMTIGEATTGQTVEETAPIVIDLSDDVGHE